VSEGVLGGFIINPNGVIDYKTFNGRPGIEAVIRDVKTKCLLDTGARINVIDQCYVRK